MVLIWCHVIDTGYQGLKQKCLRIFSIFYIFSNWVGIIYRFALNYNIYVKTFLHIEPYCNEMHHNRNKSSNYSEVQAGETLFDFLKRKKKFALEASLSRSKQNISYNSNLKQTNQKSDISPRRKYQETYRETLRQSAGVPSVGKNNQETYRSMVNPNFNATTPKRVTFADEKDKQKKLSARSSFIEMISPMKRKAGASKTPEHNASIKQTSSAHEYQKPKSTTHHPQQQFYRRNLNSSVSVLKSTLQKFISSASSIKQKSHSLFIELKPLLKLIEESSNPNFAKRASEAKIKLHTFEHLFKQFHVENGNDMLENFHQSFSEHLVSLESNLRSSFERENNEAYKKLKEEKDNKIEQLLTTKQRMGKEIDTLNRKLEKMNRQADKLKYNSQSTIERGEQSFNNKTSQLESKIQQYQMELNNLAKQLDASKQSEKALQKTIKDLKYLKQEAEKRFIEQNIRVKSTKEQFLLNQIAMLKKEFKCDMEQLTSLYSTKEKEHVAIIEQLRFQLKQLNKQLSEEREVGTKITADAVTSREVVEKLRKQNECLVTDLHRMNEQLYQHWLALKDLKTLTVRLQIYSKFSKIYEDLAFNDQLFI